MRIASILVLVTLLLPSIPLIDAQPTAGPSSVPDPAGVTQIPTVAQALADAQAMVDAQMRALTATLAANNLSVDGAQQPEAATVIHDDLDATRVGGVGGWSAPAPWRNATGAGLDGTRGWTIRGPDGRYPTMDATLLSPAIDLSAYALANIPLLERVDGQGAALRDVFLGACGSALDVNLTDPPLTNASMCEPAAVLVPRDHPLERLILLTFMERHAFPNELDGGQLVVYRHDPVLDPHGAVVLRPLSGPAYGHVAGLPGEQGFTGASGWSSVTFDLTPFLGSTIWLGFHVYASPLASADPLYFAGERFPADAAPGWDVDALDVVAPAFASDTKLFSLEGPRFRLGPTDHVDHAAPGTNVTLNATVLHPAFRTELAKLTLDVQGAANGSFVLTQTKWLAPGETWRAPIDVTVPDDGQTVTVSAHVSVLGVARNSTMPDPTANNGQSASIMSSSIRAFSATGRVAPLLIDDGETTTAYGNVTNTGNVPIDVALRLNESDQIGNNTTYVAHPPQTLHLLPQETRAASWPVVGTTRGAHHLRLDATSEGLAPWNTTFDVLVHASPPPAFHDLGGTHDAGWFPGTATMPIPLDDAPGVNGSMWVARHFANSQTTSRFPALVGSPTPEATREGAGSQFTSLRLSARWMAYQYAPPAAQIDIGYRQPLGTPVSVWTGQLGATLPPTAGQLDQNITWQEVETPIEFDLSSPYVDAWSANGLQVTVTANVPAESFTVQNASGFFLDDLQISGVPVGKDESYRIPIIHLTGNPLDGGTPAQPSACPWGDEQALQLVYTDNCWQTMTKADAEAFLRNLPGRGGTASAWADNASGLPILLDHAPALFKYSGPTDPTSDRLMTPVIELQQAEDPWLTFEHQYAFRAAPDDHRQYQIRQVGYVELQYRQDDGTWSPFVPLYPDGGSYPPAPSLLTKLYPLDPSSSDLRDAYSSSYVSGLDGYAWPLPCAEPTIAARCDLNGGFTTVFFNASGAKVAMRPDDPPIQRASFHLARQPMLAGVDLANREIRIGFRAARGVIGGAIMSPGLTDGGTWTIGDVRVTPVSVFAMDGAVEDVHLEVPFDWRAIGVGPQTKVPINATVRNVGRYPMAFVAQVNVSLLHGERLSTTNVSVGTLQPGEETYVHDDWEVPAGEDRTYVVSVRVLNATEGEVDENSLNDEIQVGAAGELVAATRADLAITAQVSPRTAQPGHPRYVSIQVRNLGNTPLDQIQIRRQLEFLDRGRTTTQESITFDLGKPLAPDPAGVRFEDLEPTVGGAAYDTAQGFITPGQAGDYVLTILADSSRHDVDPTNNFYRGYVASREAIFASDFDHGLDWLQPEGHAWSFTDGFRSASGIGVVNATSGALPAGLDAALTSPRVALSSARSAVLNFFTRYQLEDGYDGARFEASADGGATWQPLTPEGGYPGKLDASNPLVAGSASSVPEPAFTGDSASAQVNLEGWSPVSIDLAQLPGLGEDVAFATLPAPQEQKVRGLLQDHADPTVWHEPWMSTGDDASARWEIRNATQIFAARHGAMWWSGYANANAAPPTGSSIPQISRTFNVTAANATQLTLSWWEMRAGTLNSSWEGTGAVYNLRIEQVTPKNARVVIPNESIEMEVLAREGPWTHVSATILGVNTSRPLIVSYQLLSAASFSATMGWAISDIDLRATQIVDGVANATVFTQPDDLEAASWARQGGFARVARIPDVPSGWRVDDTDLAPDGTHRKMWNDTVAARADSRLVTPAIDLSQAGGSNLRLDLTHKFSFAERQDNIPGGYATWSWQKHQGGVVEVQVFNASTGRWDPWKQLWAAGPPSAGFATIPVGGADLSGPPYPKTLPDAGDTFARFPRLGYVNVAGLYLEPVHLNVSYVFTGASRADTPLGFELDRFDLSPYTGQTVRFGFHAWSGGVLPAGAFYWELGDVKVVGRVLSAPDVLLRARVGTDASGLQGSFAMDALEVSGATYGRSVAIQLDAAPARGAPGSPVVISGVAINHAPTPRNAVGVALSPDGFESASVLVGEQINPANADYAAAVFIPTLASAGQPGSSAPFSFVVQPGWHATSHRIRLSVVDATLSGSTVRYVDAPDDVPGRAHREWLMQVVNVTEGAVRDVALSPSYLAMPGATVMAATLENTGTTTIPAGHARFFLNGQGDPEPTPAGTIDVPLLDPGESTRIQSPSIALPRAGNYTITLRADAFPVTNRTLRVDEPDVAYQTDFPELGNWTSPLGEFRVVADEARFGNTSVLYGFDNAQFADQSQTFVSNPGPARFISPPIDLRGASSPVLSFWAKPRFGPLGQVDVEVTTSRCIDATPTKLQTAPRGSARDWILVTIPIPAIRDCQGDSILASDDVRFVFDAIAWDGQGWRLDGLTVADGGIRLEPADIAFPITDSAQKDYPFRITNDGLAPRDVVLDLDPDQSKLTDAQRDWFVIEPGHLRLMPGASSLVHLRASSPAARGAFPQELRASLRALDVGSPFVPVNANLSLRFRPLPRPDLAASLTVDGARLEDGAGFEEGVPHEVAASISNLGIERSHETAVALWITDEKSGDTVWQHRETIPPLEPASRADESFVVAATWTPPFAQRGNHTVHVAVDPAHVETDYDHANDQYARRVVVTRLVRPDLAVDPRSMIVSTPDHREIHEATPAQLVVLSATIRNEGVAEARDAVARIYEGGSVLREISLGTLAPGANARVEATEIAPPNSTTYTVQVSTPDLELGTANNERSLQLPIFPPDLGIASPDNVTLEPGASAEILLEVANTGISPMLVRLKADGDAPAATLSEALLALAPQERRNVTLALRPDAGAPAGPATLAVHAFEGETEVARRTIDVTIPERDAATGLVLFAAGPPSAIQLDLRAINQGNTPLDGDVLVRDEAGRELARVPAGGIAPGASDVVSLVARAPATTPPGPLAATVTLERAGRAVATIPARLDVLPWGEAQLDLVNATTEGEVIRQTIRVAYEGNHASLREGRIYGLPVGATASFEPAVVSLAPGSRAVVNLTISVGKGAAPGLYKPLVGLIDPTELEGNATSLDAMRPVALDLRAGRAHLVSARRAEGEIAEGAEVAYLARVRNDGDAPLARVPVELFVDGKLVAFAQVDVEPGKSKDVRLAWNATRGGHAVVVAVDAGGTHGADSPAIGESLDVAGTLGGTLAAKRSPMPDAGAIVLAVGLVALLGRWRRRAR